MKIVDHGTFKLSELRKLDEPLTPVVLKSGGEIMSLDRVEAGIAACSWKNNGVVHIENFDIRCLYRCIKND